MKGLNALTLPAESGEHHTMEQTIHNKWGKRVGYGVGDLGCNLVFSTMASYLMIFYTDVFGIAAAAAGTMMLVTKVIDALTDT